ncbi:hypothetical protein L3Q82_011435 [Scortum barcoo]|uniref:Uncharacterized protein n=1 Tax=Scortum barcoo TaxID=214431 RepID=A0ACB8W9Y3_9TELE|nr:hypothetical protein L3Q82_011435 [Scortum barcoo]
MNFPSPSALGCSSTNCNMVLTEAQGGFTSPCYPQKYPNSQVCKWIMQAPAGFIIQLSFLDFELEEAPGCIYDCVVVKTGNTDVKFCGPTADGLTLNSTGNMMELSFTSDFSVQKRGFSVKYQHVAVALRNQKVRITGGNGQVTEVANSVSIPALSHLTLCFEVQRISQKQTEWIFTYEDMGNVVLSLGSDHGNMQLIVDRVVCPIASVLSSSDFTGTMKQYCVLWTSTNGQVVVHFNGNSRTTTCSASSGRTVPAGGRFRLGGQQNFDGNIYNLRLWDYIMTDQQLAALSCSTQGNVIDWDNSHWSIASNQAQTDTALSCSEYRRLVACVSPPSNTPLTTSCDSPGLGCPATSPPTTSSTDSTNTIHATNATTDVLPSIIPSPSTIPTNSMPLTPTISTTTISTTSTSTSVMPATTTTITTSAATPASTATNAASASSTAHAQQTTSSTSTVSSAPTNHPDTNPTSHAKKSTLRSPTKASTIAAPVVSLQPEPPASKFEPLATHNRRSRHLMGLTVGATIRQTIPAFISSFHRRASHRSFPASSQLSPPTQATTLRDPASELRPLAPAPGSPALPEPVRPRPPASLPRPQGRRTSKTSLGFISSPLISQWRKRPTGGGRHSTSKGATSRPVIHITKPAAQLKSTTRPTNTTQTNEFKRTAGLCQIETEVLLSVSLSSSSAEGLYYRISFVVEDKDATLTQADVERAVALWLNQTIHNWTHSVSVDSISVRPASQSGGSPTSYTCQALLAYYYITNQSLGEAAVSAQLSSSQGLSSAGLQIQPTSMDIKLISEEL